MRKAAKEKTLFGISSNDFGGLVDGVAFVEQAACRLDLLRSDSSFGSEGC